MNWLSTSAQNICTDSLKAAQHHQQELTKPEGSLGNLELLAIQLAGMQATSSPTINTPLITIFAADHGIAAENISAFPQEVTVQMIQNFINGGAAISVLAKELNARFQIINLGTSAKIPDHPNMQQHIIANETKNFCHEAAMTEAQLNQALSIGKKIIDDASKKDVDVFIGGEMGIANTSSATAIACCLLEESPENFVGSGTGIDENIMKHKKNIIGLALKKHKDEIHSVLDCLQYLGGFEIAALTGAYVRAAQSGITILVDGFICTVSALLAIKINPSVRDWMIFSHESAEQAHKKLLSALNVEPLLKLNMRLGEASGSATALPLLKLACALHNNMATFTSANVSNKK